VPEIPETCDECEVCPGEFHEVGCDLERCPCCMGQLISCRCTNVEHPGWIKEEDEDGITWRPAGSKRIPWSGVINDLEIEAAVRDGKFVREDGRNLILCQADDEGAMPDANYGASIIEKKCPHQK